METYQIEFIQFAMQQEALRFGDFTLKSGRRSPYFFNTATFDSGGAMARLGYFYACRILADGAPPDVVFGPAYKGIPLAVATAMALNTHFNLDVGYCFDRKEAKTHGDQGLLVGRVPKAGDRVVMVDDVITDGATKLEAVERLRGQSGATVAEVVIALNRQERTRDGANPLRALEEAGLRTLPIVTIRDVLACLREGALDVPAAPDAAMLASLERYLAEYGV